MVSRLDLHESLSRDEEAKRPSERRFGLTFAVVLLFFTALLTMRGSGAWPASLVLALAFLALVVLAPSWLKPLNRLWLQLSQTLHSSASPVVLIALFFFVITPIGVLARLAGRDFLRLKFDRETSTYWVERRPPGPSPESMRDQY